MRFKVFDAFARTAFEGNPTGIVYYDGPADQGRAEDRRSVAACSSSMMNGVSSTEYTPDSMIGFRVLSTASASSGPTS